MLITRYGAAKIDSMLPGHIEAVKASGVPVVWQCDGVHGNTVTAKCPGNLKTRALADVLSECTQAPARHMRPRGSIACSYGAPSYAVTGWGTACPVTHGTGSMK